MELDVSTRAIRYALAVADRGNLTQAARELHLTQQALSQHIRRLERDLGFELFVRGPRGVEPTPAGAAWLQGARRGLVELRRTHDAARDAARDDGRVTLRLGYVVGAAGEATNKLLDHLAEAAPDVVLDLTEAPLRDTTAGLATGQADLALLRGPLDDADLETVELFVEPRVAVMAADDPLAARAALEPEDLVGRTIVGFPGSDPVARAFWSLQDVLGERAPAVARTADSLSEELQLVARGSLLSITASSAARFFPWPGVAFRPLLGCPGSRVLAARRRDDPRAALGRVLSVIGDFAARGALDGRDGQGNLAPGAEVSDG